MGKGNDFWVPGLGIFKKLKPIGLGPILKIVSNCSIVLSFMKPIGLR